MQELIKKRWFVFILGIIVAVVGLLLFGLILYYIGYRIVYPEQFETSWDAVSGFAAWAGILVSIASAVASFMAVWYAIRVADQQNRIALFEKRYECFQFFEECFVLYQMLASNRLEEVINVQCCHMLGVEKIENINRYDFHNKLKHFEFLLHQMAFVFPNIKENDVLELYNSLSSFFTATLNGKDIEKSKTNYLKTMTKFGKYIGKIWDTVTISDIK